MNVSYENIVDNENGYLVEINLEPSKSLTVVPEKLKNCNKKRSPLKERSELENRLENAGKRKSQHLQEIKLKSKIDTKKVQEKVQNNENLRKINILNKSEQRVKSADAKRSSLIKESTDKLKSKHEQVDKIVQQRPTEASELKSKIQEKLVSAEQKRMELLNAKKACKFVATLENKISKKM